MKCRGGGKTWLEFPPDPPKEMRRAFRRAPKGQGTLNGTFKGVFQARPGAFGDGGAMASDDIELVKKVRMLASHGREEKYTHLIKGTNSRLDTLKAAQLSICLDHLDQWNQQRRQAAALYDELLQPYGEIIRPQVPPACEAVWHVYVIRYAGRDRLAAFLNQRGIKTGLHYPLPLHLQPVYGYLGLAPGSLLETEAACREVLSLPMFPKITAEEIQAVAEAVGQFFESEKKDGS